MQICTSYATKPDAQVAIDEAFTRLIADLGNAPDLLLLAYSDRYDPQVLVDYLSTQPAVRTMFGVSSCQGVMTERGFHSSQGYGLGFWGLSDPAGSYGVGMALLDEEPRIKASYAVSEALADAGRPGELPSLIWLATSPGQEEAVIEGIQDIVGTSVPIVGGSSADNKVAGAWSLFAGTRIEKQAVVVVVLFPSGATSHWFNSGYSPTEHIGCVTKSQGRIIHEIDGRPAATVYNEWTVGVISSVLPQGGNILALTSLYPLGRAIGYIGEVPYYLLSHPESVIEGGGLALFSDIQENQEIVLMSGSLNSLISRAGRVAQQALVREKFTTDDIAGGLGLYCAGCMLTVDSRMEEVVESVNVSLQGAPFLGMFSFGEQGCLIGDRNVHGNLMISFTLFSR